jgi:hypothetical protein
MQNIPVPMDLDRNRMHCPFNRNNNNWQTRNNATNTTGNNMNTSSGACFNCGQTRHFAHNCPQRRQTNVNFRQAQTYKWDAPIGDDEQIQQQPMNNIAGQISQLQAEIGHLPPEEQGCLSDTFKDKDFSNA